MSKPLDIELLRLQHNALRAALDSLVEHHASLIAEETIGPSQAFILACEALSKCPRLPPPEPEVKKTFEEALEEKLRGNYSMDNIEKTLDEMIGDDFRRAVAPSRAGTLAQTRARFKKR